MAAYTTIHVEAWSDKLKNWIPQTTHLERRDADECAASWKRIGVTARVIERENRCGPDFVNSRGE